MKERRKILITVKTYPLPSQTYKETVCTAGVFEDGSFVRLYPIDYRYREEAEQFPKYQWIEIDIEKRTNDNRPESYKPFLSTMVNIGRPIKKWDDRKKIILQKPLRTMCQLQTTKRTECSLSIIKPRKVIDLIAVPETEEWQGKQRNAVNQQWLDGPLKTLEKPPYRFKYKYLCQNKECNSHEQTIEDWEIYALFRKMKSQYKDDAIAIQKVKEKFVDSICSKKRDTHFFVGLHSSKNAWLILGTFYPPLVQEQYSLL